MQTFVLAQQPTGYFVLNDIFRYINEEGDEEVVEAAPVEDAAGPLDQDVEMPKAQASTEEPAPEALIAEVVDKKLETVEAEAAPTPSTNGTSEEVVEAEAPVAESKEEESTPEAAEKAVEEEIKEPEKPKEPVPSPVVTRTPSAAAKPAAAKPAEPLKQAAPAKPKSWASLVGSSTPKPAVPASVTAPKTATPPAQARAAPPAKAAPVQAQTTESTVSAAEKDKENTPGAGWQTAGDNAKRQNRPQSISQAPLEKEGTMAYIRNVTEKLGPDELRSALESFGTLIYFDINRGKVRTIL